jgi:hypothetical protein
MFWCCLLAGLLDLGYEDDSGQLRRNTFRTLCSSCIMYRGKRGWLCLGDGCIFKKQHLSILYSEVAELSRKVSGALNTLQLTAGDASATTRRQNHPFVMWSRN